MTTENLDYTIEENRVESECQRDENQVLLISVKKQEYHLRKNVTFSED